MSTLETTTAARPISDKLEEVQRMRHTLESELEGLFEDLKPVLRNDTSVGEEMVALEVSQDSVLLQLLELERISLRDLRDKIAGVRSLIQL